MAVTRCCLQQFVPVHACGCGLLLAIISAHAALLVTSPVCLGGRVVCILYSVGVQAMHETNLRPSLHPLPEGARVVGGCSAGPCTGGFIAVLQQLALARAGICCAAWLELNPSQAVIWAPACLLNAHLSCGQENNQDHSCTVQGATVTRGGGGGGGVGGGCFACRECHPGSSRILCHMSEM